MNAAMGSETAEPDRQGTRPLGDRLEQIIETWATSQKQPLCWFSNASQR